MSLKLLISAVVNFLQALIEIFVFTSVILLSVFVIFSIPDNIFCITFSSSCIIKFFSPSVPKE